MRATKLGARLLHEGRVDELLDCSRSTSRGRVVGNPPIAGIIYTVYIYMGYLI